MNVAGPTHVVQVGRLRADLDAASDLLSEQVDIIAERTRDRDLARAELASARDELDAQRRTRDLLDKQLTAARRQIGQLEHDLGVADQERTEQTMRAIDAEQKLAAMHRAFIHGDTNA